MAENQEKPDSSHSADPEKHTHKHVLPHGMTGGPHGLGDPNDKTLRIVEREQIIPKRMRKLVKELCADKEKEFYECCKRNQWTFWRYCKKERKEAADCEISYFQDPEFVQKCTEDYIVDRSEYRRTGLSHKKRVLHAYHEKHPEEQAQ